MVSITSSSILCALGAIYGFYALVKHLKVIKRDVATEMKYAFPIICGTLAWTSAAYTFHSLGIESHINVPLTLMLISWCLIAGQCRARHRARRKHLSGSKKENK